MHATEGISYRFQEHGRSGAVFVLATHSIFNKFERPVMFFVIYLNQILAFSTLKEHRGFNLVIRRVLCAMFGVGDSAKIFYHGICNGKFN